MVYFGAEDFLTASDGRSRLERLTQYLVLAAEEKNTTVRVDCMGQMDCRPGFVGGLAAAVPGTSIGDSWPARSQSGVLSRHEDRNQT
jgi:hypothetical protein